MQNHNNEKPTIVIDGRVYSTDAHDRGMGRYVSFILQAAMAAGYDICLILYSKPRLKDNDPLRLKCKTIAYIDCDPAVYEEQDIHECSFEIEKIIKDAGAVAFIDATPFLFPMRFDITACPVIAIAYDLIPLRNPSQYLGQQPSVVTDLYQNGLRRLIKADSIIAISSYTKNQVSKYLGIDDNHIEVIYPSIEDEYKQNVSLRQKTIDYFAIIGSHFSKNPEFALDLFTKLNEIKNFKNVLSVPTESQLDNLKFEFPSLARKLCIRHSIQEWEKIHCQEQAKVVFHLSREEGFGIPLLEALFKNTRVICCDIRINREILEKSGSDSCNIALLIPMRSEDLNLLKIVEFIETPDTNADDHLFEKIRNYFINHWTNDAPQILVNAIETAKQRFTAFAAKVTAKMVSNTPNHFCGVADYAYSIPKGTKDHMLVYTSDISIKKMHALGNIRLKSHLCFPSDYKIKIPTIFHLAISESLWFGVELLRKYGCPNDILILHDHVYLYGLYHFHYANNKLKDFFKNYFKDEDSKFINLINNSTRLNLEEFNKLTNGYTSAWLRQKKLKLINHLPAEAEKQHGSFGNTSLSLRKEYVDIGIDDRASHITRKIGSRWRLEKGITGSDLLIGVFGSVTNNKYISEIASAVAKLCQQMQKESDQDVLRIYFLICGKVYDEAVFDKSKSHFESLGINHFFHHENPRNDFEFDGIMSTADIVISCRKQDRGQLSHIIPKALTLGRPLLTNSKSGYSMIREDCIIEEANFEENLLKKLQHLIQNSTLQNISKHNRKLFSERHNITQYYEKILSLTDIEK